MPNTFFFYDLETSGTSPRSARIMQFAGQRTSLDLKPIGKPINVLIKLTPDVLPEPDAILITKITPQQTIANGISEAEFLTLFYKQIATPNTIFVGYNNVRFDDEFIRFLNYRNLYDPYEWQWQNGNSRWDMLDVVRMTRALRPEGIKWPVNKDGKPTNRLSFITDINKIDHSEAHDAMHDVKATIEVAKLIRSKQPELFKYLLSLRHKGEVSKLVESNQPFVYTSGHYPSSILHTTVVYTLTPHKNSDAALVYDLRQDPKLFLELDINNLIKIWRYSEDPEALRLPIKTLKYNRVPAIAPLGVIKDKKVLKRLNLNLDIIEVHLKRLKEHQSEFADKMLKVVERLDEERNRLQTSLIDNVHSVDERLYDNFISNSDKVTLRKFRDIAITDEVLKSIKFRDDRLNNLLPLYVARNYPKHLNAETTLLWQKFRRAKLLGGKNNSTFTKYLIRIEELKQLRKSKTDQYLLEELNLYGQSVLQDIEYDV